MGRSPYLDQEPGGVLVLKPNKWFLSLAALRGLSLLALPIAIFYLMGLEVLINGTQNFSVELSIFLLLNMGLLILLSAYSFWVSGLLITGGGGTLIDETGVWLMGFKGKRLACIEWGKVELFYLTYSPRGLMQMVGWKLYKEPISLNFKLAPCQGVYENISKAELVELLNRWREKFGGTSEAAS